MRTFPGRRAVAAAVLAPLLIAGLTACSGDDDKKPSASKTTEPADTTPTPEGDPVDDPQALLAEIRDAVSAQSNARVQFKLGTGTAEGTMNFENEKGALELVLSDNTNQYTVRYVDNQMYVAFPGLTAPGKFIKIEKDGSTLGVDIDVDSYRNLSPATTLDAIAETVTRIGDVGEEKIDGTETTHYSVTVDAEKARELEGTSGEPGVENLPDTVTYDMYVTEDKLIRRVLMSLSENFPIELNYTDWGTAPAVVAPAKKDLIALPPDLGETP